MRLYGKGSKRTMRRRFAAYTDTTKVVAKLAEAIDTTLEDLRIGGNVPERVRARKLIAIEMARSGYGMSEIARAMHVNCSTVMRYAETRPSTIGADPVMARLALRLAGAVENSA